MWFDVQAALKEIEGDSGCVTRDTATNDAKTAQIRASVADVATLVTSQKTAGQFAQHREHPDKEKHDHASKKIICNRRPNLTHGL